MGQYKTYLVMFLLSAAGAWVFTPVSIRLARRWGALDQPSARKIHSEPTPRLGGLGVFLGFCLPWAGLYLLDNPVSATFQDFERRFAALVFGALAMLLLGIYDDVKGADAADKFAGQIGTAVILWWAGIRIEEVTNPWGGPIDLGWFGLPISVLWLVGVTNAINLLDGIDGLVTGITAVLATALAVINVLNNNILVSLLTVSLAGACLGFLPYNRTPARTFLGDCGSLTLGMMLAGISVLSFFSEGRQKASPVITVPLILFALPVFDTARVMFVRIARGRSPFQADKNHVHHRLLAMGLNQRQTAWTLYAVAAGTAAFAVVLFGLGKDSQLLWSAVLAGVAAVAYAFWRLHLKDRVEGDEESPGG